MKKCLSVILTWLLILGLVSVPAMASGKESSAKQKTEEKTIQSGVTTLAAGYRKNIRSKIVTSAEIKEDGLKITLKNKSKYDCWDLVYYVQFLDENGEIIESTQRQKIRHIFPGKTVEEFAYFDGYDDEECDDEDYNDEDYDEEDLDDEYAHDENSGEDEGVTTLASRPTYADYEIVIVSAYAVTKKKLVRPDAAVMICNGGTTFDMYLYNPVKGKTYTVRSSKPAATQLIRYSRVGNCGTFTFWAKKAGNVKLTFYEKTGKKSKKIGTASVKIRDIRSSYSGEPVEYAYLNRGLTTPEAINIEMNGTLLKKQITPGYPDAKGGVSLEVVKLSGIRKKGKTTSVTVGLAHKVTKAEVKANGKTPYYFDLYDSKGTVRRLSTKLKAGKKKLIFKSKKLKKGTTYTTHGFSRRSSSGLEFKAKCK